MFLEKKCNYHANEALNKSSVAEETVIRTNFLHFDLNLMD